MQRPLEEDSAGFFNENNRLSLTELADLLDSDLIGMAVVSSLRKQAIMRSN